MANVPGAYNKIHVEQVGFRDSVSEGLIRDQISAAVNKALAEGSLCPAGTVKKSMLTVDQFIAEQGPGWILADGSSTYTDENGDEHPISESAYGVLTGETAVPDIRGVFTRMKDNGRGEFTDLALGTSTTDQLKSHTHTFTWDQTNMIYVDVLGDGLANDDGDTKKSPLPNNSLAYTIGSTGIAESRPKSITLNFFIKIN